MSTDAVRLTPWRVKKLPDDSLAYLVPAADIKTDARKMVAHVVVSTPTLDRERDVMVPKGCRTKSHQKNPIVLLNHQKNLPGIAKSMDPDGNYTVKVTDDEVRASNWFDQGSKMAVQAFRAVESGALGGISPGFLTVPNAVHKIKANDGHAAFMYTEWDLLEISHCPIGMNPDAVVLAIEKGFGGEALVPELKELLLPYVPERKPQVVGGWEAKALADLDITEDADDLDLADAEPPQLTTTTKFFHAVHEKAFDLLGMVQELDHTLELDTAKAAAREILGHVGGVLSVCRMGHDHHVKAFPAQPGIPGGENENVSANHMAAWRVKALEDWDQYRRNLEQGVAAENAAGVAEAVAFCRSVAADRQERTAIRAKAKRMATVLSNVRLVALPPDDTEEAEWGAVMARLTTAGV